MKQIKDFECVIGLEIHIELKTKSKIFCSCPTDFGASPNTQCCPICFGLPGALPRLNKKAVEYATKAGLALGSMINKISSFDRKNYFYPDLPKGYQITQYEAPICECGALKIEVGGIEKTVGITRIHMEEDAGKLIHEGNNTLIDCNRCGVPLIEIVTEPDIRSSEEAVAFLKKLRSVLLYTGVSDCRMNEGSMRCDVNLSIRRLGENSFGERTEMKNLNSFAFTAKAIEYEYARQVSVIEGGGMVERETRRFDSSTGKTYSMRSKESARDYRFFPDPDLPPLMLDDTFIEKMRAEIPELPDAKLKRYVSELGIPSENAAVLTADRSLAEFFEAAAEKTEYKKTLANLTVGELLRLTDAKRNDDFISPVSAESLAALARRLGIGRASLYRAIDALADDGRIEKIGQKYKLLSLDENKEDY